MSMKIKKQHGAQLVEFALLLPLLIVVMFSAIEFGFMLYDQAVITNATREGARAGVVAVIQGSGNTAYPGCASANFGVVDGTSTARCVAKSYTENALVSFTSPAPAAVITATNIGACSPLPPLNTCKLAVTITYAYKGPVMSAIATTFGTVRNLQSTTVMYYE